MDPRDPLSDVESDLMAAQRPVARERGVAPAGSLMSVQIRRRTLPRDKVRQDKPEPPVQQTVHPEPPPEPTTVPPESPNPEAAPAAAHPVSGPGRRMPSVAPSPSLPPTAPVTAPIPMAPTPTAPVAAPPIVEPPIASPPSPSARPAPAARAPLTSPEIARHARTGNTSNSAEDKPALAIRAPKPAAPKPPPAPKVDTPPQGLAQTSPAPLQATRPEGIVSYWLRLRGSRRFPAKADLDQGRIVEDWPNSILMRCRIGSTALEPEKVFSSPNTAPSAAPGDSSQAAMDLSPMMLQWLLALAGDAAKDRRPMQDTEAFPSRNQSIEYGAFALPFSDDQTEINHVLCHVYRIH